MLLSSEDLLDLRMVLSDAVVSTPDEWTNVPSRAVIVKRHELAVNYLATAGRGRANAKVEPAALFFALSVDARPMGDAWHEMPMWAAFAQMDRNGLRFASAGDARALIELQDRIASSASWEDVRDWFIEHTEPMGLEEYDQHPNPHGYTEHPDDALDDSSWVDEPYPEDP